MQKRLFTSNPLASVKLSDFLFGELPCLKNSTLFSETILGVWFLALPQLILWIANGYLRLRDGLMAILSVIKHVLLLRVIARSMALISMKLLVPSLKSQQSV